MAETMTWTEAKAAYEMARDAARTAHEATRLARKAGAKGRCPESLAEVAACRTFSASVRPLFAAADSAIKADASLRDELIAYIEAEQDATSEISSFDTWSF